MEYIQYGFYIACFLIVCDTIVEVGVALALEQAIRRAAKKKQKSED